VLLQTTIEEVAVHGAFSINARYICEKAGVSFGAVNHHFGSWDGLLAAATVAAYRNYVETTWAAVLDGLQEPEARLVSLIKAQVTYARRMSGWSAVINYPGSFEGISTILQSEHKSEMSELLELNLARLGQLTIDVRENSVTEISYGAGEVPRAALMKDSRAVARSTIVGWTSLGMSVWASSSNARAEDFPEAQDMFEQIMNFAIAEAIEGIKKDRN
jgi:AcrR family transcriptional regulator